MTLSIRRILTRWAASILSSRARQHEADRRADTLDRLRRDIADGRVSPLPPREIVVAGVRRERRA